MTITTLASRWSYLGDGVTAEFPFTSRVFVASDLHVYVDAVEVASGYAVTGVDEAAGGAVVFEDAPEAGAVVVLARRVPSTQEVDYRENDAFRAETHERALDRLTVLCQQLGEDRDRTLTLSPADPTEALRPLPLPHERAGRYLSFGADGQPVLGDALIGVPTSLFGMSLVDDPDASAALTTLGLTALARALVASATQAAMREVLGLGSSAVIDVQGVGAGRILREDGEGDWLSGILTAADPPPQIANAASAPTTTVEVASKACTSDAGSVPLYSTGVKSKRIDAAWWPGNGQGGMDAGIVEANTWYSVWVVAAANRIQDVLFSKSATSPALPSGYLYKRRVGWVRTDAASAIVAFRQEGDRFWWLSPRADMSSQPAVWPGTTLTVSAPPSSLAQLALYGIVQSQHWKIASAHLSPTWAASEWEPMITCYTNDGGNSHTRSDVAVVSIPVDGSARIRVSRTGSVGFNGFTLSTLGWIDRRGCDR